MHVAARPREASMVAAPTAFRRSGRSARRAPLARPAAFSIHASARRRAPGTLGPQGSSQRACA
eukprot:9492890-Alexandrium_andersonii.AAC.1